MSVQKILNIYQIIKNYQEIIGLYKLDRFIKDNSNKLINHSNEILIGKIKNENNNNLILRNNKINKMIIYKSKIISKLELSIELLYNIFFRKKDKIRNRNIFFNLIFELFKCGAKIKELYSLQNIGISFYLNEDIFYNDFLGIDKNKFIENIANTSDINNIILPIHGNLFLPIKKKINNNKYKNKFINDIINIESQDKIIYNKKYISKINYVGEILYLLRPIIYLTLLTLFKENKIIPLIVNIILDIIIYFSRIEINRNNYKNYGFNFLIQKIHFLEMKYRNKNFFVYIFREPIFSFIIIPLMHKIFNILHLPNFIVKTILNIMDNFTNYSYIA